MGGSKGQKTVLCWVDGGAVVGLGHVSRALAVAEALDDQGIACEFAIPADPTVLGWLGAAGAHVRIVLSESVPALPAVLAAPADAVVVDVPQPLGRREVRALCADRPVLLIDNAGAGVAEADLVLAPFGTARDGRWLVGAEHVPLRRGLRLAGDLRAAGPVPETVLVSMGASDPGGLTIAVLEGIALARSTCPRLLVRVVANPATPIWPRLPAVLRRLGSPPASPVAPDAMLSHLAGAEVVVTAMGVTVYEALACGVPAIVLCRTQGDVAHAAALAAQGAIVSLGVDWTEERIGSAVAGLLSTPVRRAAMTAAGRTLVDGRGAERVATRLVTELGRRRSRRIACGAARHEHA